MNFYKMWCLLEAIEGNTDAGAGAFLQKISYSLRKPDHPLEREQIVQFALYCAKDCFNNIDEKYTKMKENSKNCIDLVQQWLDNPESVTSQQLINIARDTYYSGGLGANAAAKNAKNAAADAAYTGGWATYTDASGASTWAAYAAKNATFSFYYKYNENKSIRSQKQNEYLNVIHSFSYRETDKSIHKLKLSALTQDPKQLNAALDYIEENNIPLFVQDNNGIWHVHFPGWEDGTYGNKDLYKLKQDILTSELPFFERVRHYIKQLYSYKQNSHQKHPKFESFSHLKNF